jgi:hypothetical protein
MDRSLVAGVLGNARCLPRAKVLRYMPADTFPPIPLGRIKAV